MESLIHNLGLDWKLLLSQGVNFLIVLVVLRLTVYKPLLAMMRKRRETIEQGLEKAAEADRRLAQVDELQKQKLHEAQQQGLEVIQRATATGKEEEKKIVDEAHRKHEHILQEAQEKAQALHDSEAEKIKGEAAQLVKEILVGVVKVSPQAIDEALIKKVAQSAGSAKQ